jgi:hypothetical protein
VSITNSSIAIGSDEGGEGGEGDRDEMERDRVRGRPGNRVRGVRA